MSAAATDWRERATLSIAETAKLLSVSESHVRRKFHLVDVYGAQRVRVREVLELLGEPVATSEAPDPLTPDRKADATVDRIFSRQRARRRA